MRHGLSGSRMPGSTQQKFLLAKSGISLYSLLGSLAHKKREGRQDRICLQCCPLAETSHPAAHTGIRAGPEGLPWVPTAPGYRDVTRYWPL